MLNLLFAVSAMLTLCASWTVCLALLNANPSPQRVKLPMFLIMGCCTLAPTCSIIAIFR